MANLAKKNDIYILRFRYQGKEYKRSLQTSDRDDAQEIQHTAERTIRRLQRGVLQVPEGVDVAKFIVSGGVFTAAAPAVPLVAVTTRTLVTDYLASEKNKAAETYYDSQKIHLGHFQRHLGPRTDQPCPAITCRDVNLFLQGRLAIRDPCTVEKERITLRKLYDWAVAQRYLKESPAAGIPRFVSGHDRPIFRTLGQIAAILARGGLTDKESLELWECLYLTTSEIAGLLQLVRTNAKQDFSYLLHALPAFTGMRRGEVLRLRWSDVDFEGGYLTARSRKQSRTQQETSRQIDIHPQLMQTLEDWRRNRPKGQFVVSAAKGLLQLDGDLANRCFWQPLRHTDWCLDNSKNWFKIGFHTYRHSFASNLAAAEVDQRLIDTFMGHQTEAMRLRYQHLTPKNRRDAIGRLSFKVS